ncbi:MAG: DUF3540 domain-containing protein [Desulfobulbus sp.]
MADRHNILMFKQPATPGLPDMETSGATIDTARVIRRDDTDFLLVTTGAQALRGKKAVGCLLEPEENDTVLIVRNLAAGVYILTVLERCCDGGRVMLPSDTTLCVTDGALRLAGDTVELVGKTAASIDAPEIKLQGIRGEVSFAALSLSACVAAVKAGKLSLVVSTMETVAERITQRVKDCFRWVARTDSTKAGQVNISTEHRFDLKAGDASLVAKHGVKIDGDQIHLG